MLVREKFSYTQNIISRKTAAGEFARVSNLEEQDKEFIAVYTTEYKHVLSFDCIVDSLCGGEVQKTEIPKALKINLSTGEGTLQQIRTAISLALIQSMPIPDESDKEDRQGSGIMEIPKFIIIATAKFHFSEEATWKMTPRKFSLLNDAYREINGLKKEEEYASLLSLP